MAKLLLEIHELQKSYGEQTVLQVGALRVYEGEKIALIGENGAGKSTLLSILAGETEPDAGTVRRSCPAALIRQSGDARMDGSAQMARRMDAPQAGQGLSGGELTRRRIAEALSSRAPLLLADEPTTDLDAGGAERLKELLSGYSGALILVSHDRALLDALCTRVLHLQDGQLTDFPGNYTQYRAENERRRAFQQFEYEQYRSEQARLRAQMQQKVEWAASVKKAPKRMGNSEARLHTHEYTNAVLKQSAAKKRVQDRLDRLEKVERPRDLPQIRMALGTSCPIEGKTALTVDCRRLLAGGRTLIESAGFVLPTGSKTVLTGDNGTGKTTLLRALRGVLPPGTRFEGEVRFNPAARPGYFDQDHAETLLPDRTALENAMALSAQSESTARTVLARLNLRGDAVFKPVRVLSGGERAKIALARLLLSDANLLVLDEPTNHLDLFTMEALQELLTGYGGTLLFVSHDRAFISAVAGRVLSLERGGIRCFEGTLAQRSQSDARDRSAEQRQLAVTSLEMRLSALAARLASPKKGDRPDELSAQYDALAEELRQLKRQ